MFRIFLMLLTFICFQSCSVFIHTTELNTYGVVKSSNPKINGDWEYKIEVDPKERIYIRLITPKKLNVGDTILLYSKINQISD